MTIELPSHFGKQRTHGVPWNGGDTNLTRANIKAAFPDGVKDVETLVSAFVRVPDARHYVRAAKLLKKG